MSDLKTSQGIQTHIKQISDEAARFTEGLENKLEQARTYKMDAGYQSELERQLEAANAAYKQTLSDWQAKLKEALRLEAQEAETKQAGIMANAAETEAKMKSEMQSAWIRSGGNPDTFEEVWPDIYKREMTKRTLSVNDEGSRNTERLIKKYY